MKRTLAIALALVLALSLAACSGGNSGNTGGNNSTTPPANSTTTTPPADTAPNDNGGDTKTVAGYLAQFGLTEDDIKAEGFTSFEGPNGWLIKVNASANQFDTWSKKVYDAIKATSTDGKVYQAGYPTLGESEAVWSAGIIMFDWAYNYNGNVVNCTATRTESGTAYNISLH